MRTVYFSVIAAALAAAPAAAQICTGFPTVDGQKAITAGVGFPEDATTYSLRGAIDLNGPLSVNGGAAITTIDQADDNAYEFGGNVAYELKGLSFSACPTVGLTYATISSEVAGGEISARAFAFPIGFGIGQTFSAGPRGSFGLFAIPAFVFSRGTAEFDVPGASFKETETDTYFAAEIGGLFSTGIFFAGANVQFTSVEDSEALFGIRVGMLLGRR